MVVSPYNNNLILSLDCKCSTLTLLMCVQNYKVQHPSSITNKDLNKMTACVLILIVLSHVN